MTNDTPPWDLDTEDKANIDDLLANYILDQGDKALRHTLDIADKTTTRAFTVLLFMVPVTSTIISFLITELHKGPQQTYLNVGFFLLLVIACCVNLFFLIRLVFPRNTMVVGREPRDIAVKSVLTRECSSPDKVLILKINEIKNCQHRISYNKKQNAERIERFSQILKWTGITALLSTAVYLLILCL
ncbi:hypothetical protein [Mucilaginibacter lacusdianchii]|uniref:hypothetical protein n=1 Tax=Mucilaginibacter lacusdianchii TaxID=2684211 RepID=UPI00131D595F|nr:hypothetical protein [Mucilaginibacter sp. JXJ CY 39]